MNEVTKQQHLLPVDENPVADGPTWAEHELLTATEQDLLTSAKRELLTLAEQELLASAQHQLKSLLLLQS